MQSSIPMKLRASGNNAAFVESLGQTLPGKILLAVSATMFVAACAHVSLQLPFTPVPLTLQDFAVILVGMALGPVAGFSAMILYLAEGAMGLPVFNPLGLGGVAQLLGATGGYLFSYPLAAAVAGLAGSFKRGNMSSFSSAVLAGIGATAVIFCFGGGWIAYSRHLNLSATWYVAIAPFLFGACAKIVAAAAIFGATRRWLRS